MGDMANAIVAIETRTLSIGNSLMQWRKRVVFRGTARRQPRQYVGKRVCWKLLKIVIMGHLIFF